MRGVEPRDQRPHMPARVDGSRGPDRRAARARAWHDADREVVACALLTLAHRLKLPHYG
jgi:hypothetical protein